MIHDLDETIKQILYTRGRLNRDDVDIVFDQPTGEWAASLNKPTINLYLYDIRENLERRYTAPLEVERTDRSGKRIFPPRRVDINYLITVWAKEPEDEHQLLWRILETLMPMSHIEVDMGVGAVRDQPLDMPLLVALPSDAVRNMPDLWGVMENQLKPSINLMVTIALDPKKAIESPLVLSTNVRFGKKAPNEIGKIIDFDDHEIYHIGGRVMQGNDPVGAGVEVRLVNRPEAIKTDGQGRYVFAAIYPGDYEVDVTIDDRRPKRLKLTVPSDNYDLFL
ncbi:MAG: hypothetical protein CUN55_00760 [Phototrophicales bacterium]|nr:MAG: hypothetical protein CUN55_00760 [Phototrophicales bacterium]